MKFNDGRMAMTVACVILGLMITVQYRSTQGIFSAVTTQRAEELAAKVTELQEENKALSRQLNKLGGNGDKQLKELRYDAGLEAVTGPGVIVTVDDSREPAKPGVNNNLYLIHDEDLLRIINELRAAGAEAISINDQRLMAMSEIRCVGPNVNVNGKTLANPFEIKAIGNQKALESALNLRGGVKENLKYWGITLTIKKEHNLVIPAFSGSFRHEYATVVAEGEPS